MAAYTHTQVQDMTRELREFSRALNRAPECSPDEVIMVLDLKTGYFMIKDENPELLQNKIEAEEITSYVRDVDQVTSWSSFKNSRLSTVAGLLTILLLVLVVIIQVVLRSWGEYLSFIALCVLRFMLWTSGAVMVISWYFAIRYLKKRLASLKKRQAQFDKILEQKNEALRGDHNLELGSGSYGAWIELSELPKGKKIDGDLDISINNNQESFLEADNGDVKDEYRLC